VIEVVKCGLKEKLADNVKFVLADLDASIKREFKG
jgi:hypothetical protein